MKAHILLVEDDLKARLALTYRLQYAGYHVTQAPNGETAITLLEQHAFDVVLTDIVLGDVDGIEVLHRARMQPYRPIVILLTGHATLDTSLAALRAGAYDYLMKPCTDDALLTCVAGAVQRFQAEQRLIEAADLISNLYGPPGGSPQARATEVAEPESSPLVQRLHIGVLSVGKNRQEVILNGRPIHVTPTEYALLRCLAENPTQVCSYQDIVRHTHGFEATEADAQQLLKPHIRNLRRKLPADYLRNDRGTGYRLIDPETHAVTNPDS